MNPKRVRGKIDWMITLLPLTIIIVLCILFFFCTGTVQCRAEPDPILFRRYLWYLLSGDWTGYFHPVTVHCLFEVRGTLFWVNPTKSLSIPSLHGAP